MLPDVWALLKPRWVILAFGFVLMLVNRLSAFVPIATTKYLLDDVINKRQLKLLAPIIAVVLAATFVQAIASFGLTQLISKSAQRMIAELRIRVQAHIGRLPVAFFDSNKTGVLISRIMSDVEGVRNLIGTGLIEFVGGIVTSVIALVLLLRISVFMTACAAGILVIFGFGLSRAFKVIRPIFRARPKINAEVVGRLNESLSGVRVVKGYHAEAREEAVFQAGVHRLLANVLQMFDVNSVMSFGATMLVGIISAIIMWIGGHDVPASMSLGTFVTYTFYLGMLVSPMTQIVGLAPQITEALAGLERTREVLNEKVEEDGLQTTSLDRIEGRVAFEDVGFGYEPGKPVLFDVSFESAPDTVTALVGPSGSGKSTIIGLVAAFYAPVSGRVLVDGHDLSSIHLGSYRTQLGVVLQETFLFDGSIAENVAFGRPGASQEEILAACRIARVDEFAETFENRYETIVGERGIKLSGGQKQRVSIARAILADPRILILDEATSSLDSESEALIQEGLRYLMRGRTTFVIAHRLSTIRRADQILVLERGRIIERGTHESLYSAGGRYFDLYTKQHGVEANLFLAPGEGKAQPDDAAAADFEDAPAGDRPESSIPAIRLIREPKT